MKKQLKKLNETSEKVSKRRIALSPEARENQMISFEKTIEKTK
nr:MAG TPA: hypothetical protein [Caudoviricetes sp.]